LPLWLKLSPLISMAPSLPRSGLRPAATCGRPRPQRQVTLAASAIVLVGAHRLGLLATLAFLRPLPGGCRGAQSLVSQPGSRSSVPGVIGGSRGGCKAFFGSPEPPPPPPPEPSPGFVTPLDATVDDRLRDVRGLLESDWGRRLSSVAGEERLESIKASLVATVFGAVPLVPVAFLDGARLTPRWEYQLDMLALQIFLFGLVYRYAVREGDRNPKLGLGVLGAFVLPRALFLVELPAECVAGPLSCGPPLGYFSWAMLSQAAWQGFTGGVAMGGALYGLERAFSVGLVRRFSGQALEAEPAAVQDESEGGWRLPW